MKKKIFILILVLSLALVPFLFVGKKASAYELSDDYEGETLANNVDFYNLSLTIPADSSSYYSSLSSTTLLSVRVNLSYLDEEDYSHTLNCGSVIEVFTDETTSHKHFGVRSLDDGYQEEFYLNYNVYYYDDDDLVNVPVSTYHSSNTDMDVRYYSLIDITSGTGYGRTYYIEYIDYYLDVNGSLRSPSVGDPYVYYLASDSNFGSYLVIDSFNYFPPLGEQISDVLTGTFTLGTSILSALSTFFTVLVFGEGGTLSWITVFLFAMLGISLVIGMSRWISSLIRRKI